tara:strand:+ start:1880 stop:2269 length:390 start_codon:yes stop_codon:yes gene_type:complete
MKLEYFKISEFDCNCCGANSGKENMDIEFLEMLDCARSYAGIPFHISSGFRCKNKNQDLINKGHAASKTSSHLIGRAADIVCTNSKNRALMVGSLLEAGFMRIGISGKNGFIHVDNDIENKSFPVIWLY